MAKDRLGGKRAGTNNPEIVTADQLVQAWNEEVTRVRNENAAREKSAKEIKDIYDYIDKKGGQYVTIGANTKAYEQVLRNAKSVRFYDNDEMYPTSINATAKKDVDNLISKLRTDIKNMGSGKRGMKMTYYKSDDEFMVSLYPGYHYRIKIR